MKDSPLENNFEGGGVDVKTPAVETSKHPHEKLLQQLEEFSSEIPGDKIDDDIVLRVLPFADTIGDEPQFQYVIDQWRANKRLEEDGSPYAEQNIQLKLSRLYRKAGFKEKAEYLEEIAEQQSKELGEARKVERDRMNQLAHELEVIGKDAEKKLGKPQEYGKADLRNILDDPTIQN